MEDRQSVLDPYYTTSNYDFEVHDLDYIVNWYELKCRDQMPVIVAEHERNVIGFGTYGQFRPKEGYKYSVEHSVYIQKDHQGKGIGILLLHELISTAKKEGYHSMIAGIDALNAISINMHNKVGFKEVGRFKEVGYKFNTWLDLVFMQLMLDK